MVLVCYFNKCLSIIMLFRVFSSFVMSCFCAKGLLRGLTVLSYTVITIDRGQPLSRSQNEKHYVLTFLHDVIRAKTHGIWRRPWRFPAKITQVYARSLLRDWENLILAPSVFVPLAASSRQASMCSKGRRLEVRDWENLVLSRNLKVSIALVTT